MAQRDSGCGADGNKDLVLWLPESQVTATVREVEVQTAQRWTEPTFSQTWQKKLEGATSKLRNDEL